MRNYIILILLSVLTFNMNANNNPELSQTTCRASLNKMKRFSSLSERVKADLVSGIWTEDLNMMSLDSKDYRTFRFKHSGEVEITTVKNGKRNTRSTKWSVKVTKMETRLVLETINPDFVESYKLEQTCDGLVLTGLSSDAFIILDYAPLHTTSNKGGKASKNLGLKSSPANTSNLRIVYN